MIRLCGEAEVYESMERNKQYSGTRWVFGKRCKD